MIAEIYFKNWQCFRGEHTIRLQSKAYAITARYEYDRERSNMGGKSAILEAVEFAFDGSVNKHRSFDANGWITRGEKEGCVRITFEDGSWIQRSRVRGSATEVEFFSNGVSAKKESAEKKLFEYLCFNEDDYRTVAYFAQGTMARLIRTEPEKRFEIIRNWLGLEKAEKAEERTSDMAADHMKEVVRLKSTIATYEKLLEQSAEDRKDITAEREARKAVIARIYELGEERKLVRRKEELQQLISTFETTIAAGKAVAARIEAMPYSKEDLDALGNKLQDEYNEIYGEYSEASRDVETKQKVKDGEFSGACPVAPIKCPATKTINADRLLAKKALGQALEKQDQLRSKWMVAKEKNADFNTKMSEFRAEIKLRTSLREQAEEMRDKVIAARRELKTMKVRSLDEIDQDYAFFREKLEEVDRLISKVEAAEEQYAKLEEKLSSAREELSVSARLAATANQGRSIFRATQRRLAERALDSIKHRANKMLLVANVDLKIDIRWEREGKNLAKTCDMCGMAFPASAKVKICTNCETERGLHIVHRLEFLLSDRSGAADDFAGISMQLAAGSWLLHERQSPWATAMIDEPFAQMDKTIRKATARQLLTMLGSTSYRQILVISHSDDTTQMYPGKINVFVAKDGSRTIETI